jgi:hypothetical protein
MNGSLINHKAIKNTKAVAAVIDRRLQNHSSNIANSRRQ